MTIQSESLPPLAPPPYYHHNNNNNNNDTANTGRPSLGFPLGTALLLVVIFCLSGVFSCCYHWEKLRSFTRSFSHHHLEDPPHLVGLSKPTPNHMNMKGKIESESYTVLMPGDEVPKFIAMPCPRQPPRPEGNIHFVELPKPPKPPRMAVPLY